VQTQEHPSLHWAAVTPDSEIVAASLGDPDRFGEIYERYGHRVLGYVAKRVPRVDAADLTGEVFLKAFNARRKYDTARPFALPWLLGIATNVIGDYQRKRARRFRIGIRPEPSTQAPVEDVATERADAAGARPALEQALSSLNPGDRSSLILLAVEGLSYEAIGEALGVPVGTVKSRVNRARKKVREHLGDSQRIQGEEQQ
jgi:RNA polymerase sigma factor (sigma-70 family)